MYRSPRPLEELALDLLFESYGESRYNRSPEDYDRLIKMVPRIDEAHYRVNAALTQEIKDGRQRFRSICRFKAGDLSPHFDPYPTSISKDTIRNALTVSGFRRPKWKKRTT